MGSISIASVKKIYPGKSESEAAAEYARKNGYVVVVKYRNSPDGEYLNFGACSTYDKVKGYFDSPYCYDTEVVYDAHDDSEGYQELKCPQCNYTYRLVDWSFLVIKPSKIGLKLFFQRF